MKIQVGMKDFFNFHFGGVLRTDIERRGEGDWGRREMVKGGKYTWLLCIFRLGDVLILKSLIAGEEFV